MLSVIFSCVSTAMRGKEAVFATRLAALAGLSVLAACGSTPRPAPPPPVIVEQPEPTPEPVMPEPEPQDPVRTGLVPPHMADRDIARIAILLPFSSSSTGARTEALRLLRAAELALFDRAGGDLLLIPKDTEGTVAGARSAARAAVEDGADMIIGPLFGPAVSGAGQVARQAGIPMLAFTTDTSTAGNGVYLLSFPPEIEVERVVEFTTRQGVERFGFIGPQSPYGMAVHAALQDVSLQYGAMIDSEAFYTGDVEAMSSASARLAQGRFAPPRTGDQAVTETPRLEVPLPFQAVMMPESGTKLRALGPLLISRNITPNRVRFLGTGLWQDPELLREPALRGAWFAGPSQDARDRFENAYRAAYGNDPSRIASLAYDAVAVAAHLDGGEDGFSRTAIEDPQGFLGADGLFRFRSDGRIDRGLAIYELQPGGFRVIDPAPETFEPVVN
ncbi:penicillin-binding protein activator [Maricaulis sp. CAU 1757]